MSTGIRSSLLSRYCIKSHIIVAPNFFDRAEFESPITKPDLIQHLHSQSKKVVVYTGTLGFVNDPEYIAKLAYYLIRSPVHFIVIGDGNRKNQFLETSRSLGVLDLNLTYLPTLPREDALSFLQHSDFSISTILPISELENNSANKFFESLASNSCTLINHSGWMKSLLDTTHSGLSLGYDPYQASIVLLSLISSPSQLATYASNGKKLAYNKFEKSIITEQVLYSVLNSCQ